MTVFRFWFWITLKAFCLVLYAGHAWAGDQILERAYWSDVTGQASFEQAQQQSYQPYTGVLSKGFSPHVQWIRLQIPGSDTLQSADLVLRIRPVYLDDIALFDPADPASLSGHRKVGDLSPWESTEFESLHHTFSIPVKPHPRQIWLRLATASTQLIHVEALTPREMLRTEHTLWLIYSGLLAVILSFLIWVLLAWLRDRDPVNGAFAIRQTILWIYTASYLGYHRSIATEAISPHTLDLLYCWLVLLTTGSSLLFEYRLLREYTLAWWGHRLMQLLVGTSAVAMGLLMLGYKWDALRLNMHLNAAALLVMLLVSLSLPSTSQQPERNSSYHLPKWALITYYLSILLVLALSILPSLGLVYGTLLSIYGVLLYGLISGLFMTGLLIVRARQSERIRQEVANHLFLSREQLAIETRRRQDQSQMLNMLMHELKTPLAVIEMSLQGIATDNRTQGFVGRSIRSMQSILERCVQTDQLVEQPFDLDNQRIDLAEQLGHWLHEHQDSNRFDVKSTGPAFIHTDPHYMQIIVNNLLENALKYGDTVQNIHIRLSPQVHSDGRAGTTLQICNAPGTVGWPDADKLFSKYYRSATALRQSGTGLGLFLSHNLAQHMHAELRYRPQPTMICFELWLPA